MLKKVRFIILSFVVILSFSTYQAYASGIPVVDEFAIAQDAANFLKTLNHYTSQLQEMQRQYQQQVKQYQSFTDVRGMMRVLNSYYDKLKEINPQDALDRYGIVDPSTLNITGDTAEDFKRGVDAASTFLSSVDKLQKQTVSRFDDLQNLIDKVDTLQDPKDALDLQARIQAEHAMLQNESLKVQLVAYKAQAEKMMQEQKMMQNHIDFANTPAPKW